MNKLLLSAAATLTVLLSMPGDLRAQISQVCGTAVAADATSVSCENGNLDGVAELESLKKLKVRAKLAPKGLEPLAEHPSLEVLDLAETSVGDEQIQHLGGLKNLAALNLSNTQITDDGLSALTSLLVLRKLSLKGTKIDGSGLKHLAKLPLLKWVDLSDTNLSDDAISDLARLKAVREMSLDGTGLSVEGVERLREKLSRTDIRAVGLGEPFEVCGQSVTVDVTTLTCEPESADGSKLKNLSKMIHLTELTIRGGEVPDRAMRYIRGEKIERIDLTGTLVNDRGLAKLADLPALRSINLTKTLVTDDGLSELAEFENLSEVFVAGTPVTAEGEAAFERARKDVRVVR